MMMMVRTWFGIMPLKDLTMERKRVEEFEESLRYRLCVNQSCFSLACRITLLDHSIYQYEIGPFLTTSQTPNGLLIDMGMMSKGFGNVPLKDLTMERKRVEEFEESLCEDYG